MLVEKEEERRIEEGEEVEVQRERERMTAARGLRLRRAPTGQIIYFSLF